ncbi:MAG: energy transducer TonB [Candidatus Eisenbacteria bacterium]|nr:energy transducer TonB [Candidatus Eisenbacteria bacterium]
MIEPRVSLYEFMPYGAPELKEVAKKYMFRGVAVATGASVLLYLMGLGTSFVLAHRPHETSVIIVPYRELQAPPPLTDKPPPPKVEVMQPVAPPTAAAPVPVPDAEAPPEQKIASQEEISASTPGVTTGDQNIQVAPPSDDDLPKFGEYVYVEELPELITKVNPVYPEMAREANVDGTVQVQALVGKDGRVKDVKVIKSIPMLNEAAISAVRQWVFKPALANNKPVAVWVGVPVRFTLHGS